MQQKFKFTCDYILQRLNPLLGTKLGFFLLWPERSGATT